MLIYLASPYSHPNYDVREVRCKQVQRVCAELARRSIHVIAPIAHWAPIAQDHNLPYEYEFWQELDRKMIRACDEIWVLTLDGWQDSRGITYELRIAREFDKPVKLMDPVSLFLEPVRQ